MTKISTATQEQWDEIDRFREWWLTGEQIKQTTLEEATRAVHATGLWDGPVHLVKSPAHAKRIASEFEKEHNKPAGKMNFYCGQWASYRDGWFHGAKILGVKFDEKLDKLHDFCTHCPVWFYDDVAVYVLKKPDAIHWVDGELHNENGPAVEYSDEFNLWSIRGVDVDEQIVMAPHTQTIAQIDAEDNAERKRIRIERYGWEEYLTAKNANVIDERTNEVEQTYESLLSTDEMRALLCSCPSTGRVYVLEVPMDVTTCHEAQVYLRGGLQVNMVGGN